MTRPMVVIELAQDVGFARDLAAGGIFIVGCALDINAECELVVQGSGGEIRLPARVVYVDPARGAGLELVGFGPAMKEKIARVGDVDIGPIDRTEAVASAPAAVTEPAPPEPSATTTDDVSDLATGDATAADATAGDVAAEATGDGASGDGASGDGAGDDGTFGDGDGDEATDADGKPLTKSQRIARNVHERLRGLTLVEQIKAANSSDPSVRMTLERMYGKTVWEPLLRNPRLTAPEVARIARMGALPRIQLEIIVNNGAWLQIPEVRRALLSNPRLGTDQIMRILRMLPKHELKLASTLTVYPYAVRDQAKRMMKDD